MRQAALFDNILLFGEEGHAFAIIKVNEMGCKAADDPTSNCS